MTTPTPKQYLDSTAIQHAEYARNTFRVTIPAALDLAELQREDFWRSVAERFHVADKIEVIKDDLSFYGEFLVVAASRQWLRIKQITTLAITENETRHESHTEEYKVQHRGPKGWSVLRVATGDVLVEKLPQRIDADKWLENHVKAQAA